MNKVMYQIDFRDWSLVTMPTMGHLDQPQQAAPFIVLERLKHCSGTVLNGVNRENHTFISPISWHLCVHVDISANNSLQFGTLINRVSSICSYSKVWTARTVTLPLFWAVSLLFRESGVLGIIKMEQPPTVQTQHTEVNGKWR